MKRISMGRIAGALLLAALIAPESALAGTFTALTYNVAGLPQGTNPGQFPAVNTPLISPKLNAYDIVLVQEDFKYHTQLIADVTHPYQSVKSTHDRPGTAVPNGLGDGLNTLSRTPFTDFTRVMWTDCFGVFTNSSDCLAPKGFTFQRNELAPGVFLDVYNLHADVGSAAGDLNARRLELRQLYAFIGANSAGNAVLVMGDTNSRYTRNGDILPELLSVAGLTDVWVALARGGSVPVISASNLNSGCAISQADGNCERLDKIFYRSSTTVVLTPTLYSVPTTFVDGAGAQLSDHYPVAAKFNYSFIPEPGALLLVTSGLAGLAFRGRAIRR